MLALGLNIVVGFAGLLDLGYIAFYAVGAYLLRAARPSAATSALHLAVLGCILPLGALLAGALRRAAGRADAALRGDYLAIVTLGFGEIIRIFLNNLNAAGQHHQRPAGHHPDRPVQRRRLHPRQAASICSASRSPAGARCTTTCSSPWSLLVILVSMRLQDSRIGRAWVAIREDEIAAKAMGINTRNIKLLAFAMGASFGGVAGGLFAGFQGFVSPESFSLIESMMVLGMVVLGGMGHIPGVILGAVLLSVLPEVLRYGASRCSRRCSARSLVDPEILRMLLFGLALIVRHAAAGPPGCGRRPSASASSAASWRRRAVERMSEPLLLEARAASASASAACRRWRTSSLTISARRDLRPDRPQRRRQDHLLQRPHRAVPPDGGELRVRRRSRCAGASRTRWPRPASRAPSRTSACSPI